MCSRTLLVAISPCPNDTFCFQRWAEGYIPSSLKASFSFHDIETLNVIAKTSALYDVTKLSTACLAHVRKTYVPLTAGAAFAENGGPKIVAKRPFPLHDLKGYTIAVPGINTSAFAAMGLLYGQPLKIVEMPYSEIIKSIVEGSVDAGLVIHESRFVCAEYGLYEVVDIGDAYFARFKAPLPLGVIAARRSLGTEVIEILEQTLRQSIVEAKRQQRLTSFVTDKAQELKSELIWKHINHFVTQETEMMTENSSRWIEIFLKALATL